MEYIGLIGLIGLLGIFSGKRMENKFIKLRDDASRNEENINDLETQVERQAQLLIEFQKEIDRLNFILKNYTTIGELSNFSRQMKREILQEFEQKLNFGENFNESSNDFEQRIITLETENRNLQEKFSAQDELNVQIEQQIELFAESNKERDNLKLLLKNCATISDLNEVSSQIKREISKELEQNSNSQANYDESSKTLEQRIITLETENRNLQEKFSAQDELNVQIEQQIEFFAESNKERDNLKLLLKNCATISDLNEVSSQIKREISKELKQNSNSQANYDESSKTLEQRITALESDNKKLLNRILTQGKIIAQFEQNLKSETSSINYSNNFEQRIASLESDKKELLNKIARQEVLIIQYQTNFQDLQKAFDEQIIAYEERLRHIENRRETEMKIISEVSNSRTLIIQNFRLENIVGPLFTNNPAEISEVLHTIENVWEILSFLENSKFERKEIFIRVIKNYLQNLQKFTDKVRQGKFDEESFSEKVTNAFFDTLSKYFLATLPISIYRNSGGNTEFYSEFLKKINEYLTACHVYTELIEPKKLIDNDIIEKMQVVKKETLLQSEDKIIDEVERLPYFMDYFTNENDEESFCFEGKLILLKFNGDKKN